MAVEGKRIANGTGLEVLSVAGSTIGRSTTAEKLSDSETLSTLHKYHIETALPTGADIVTGMSYMITTATQNYPIGIYAHNGTGWVCTTQLGNASLIDWTGSVAQVLVSGVSYTVDVTANVTALNLTLTAGGSALVNISNATLYTITNPVGASALGATGLDGLSATAANQFILTLTGGVYTASAVEQV